MSRFQDDASSHVAEMPGAIGPGAVAAPGRLYPDPDEAPEPPGRASTTILAALLALEIVAVGLLYVPMPPNPDHELYDYMAWKALADGGLYRNGGDMNMPGEALLHIASMKAFGNHYWSYRLLDYLVLLGTMGGVAALCRPYYGKIFSGLFLGLYPIIYTTSGYWMTGQRDLLATHAILLAGFALLRRAGGGGVGWLLLPGAAIFAAALLKPTFLAFVPIQFALIYGFTRPPIGRLAKDVVLLGAVGVALLGSVLALGWATDSLRAWREMTFTFSLQNYVGGSGVGWIIKSFGLTLVANYNWFMLMALAGLICMAVEGRREPLSVVLSVMATVVISTFVQRKGFGYHMGGLLAVMSLLCAFYLTEIVRLSMRIVDTRLRLAVLSFPVLLVCGGLLSKINHELGPQARWYLDRSRFASMLGTRAFDDVFEAADFVRSSTNPGETVWINHLHPAINTLSGRSFPGRFVSIALVRFVKASPLGEEWRREIEAVFRDHPPKFIVLQLADPANPNNFAHMQDIRPYEPVSAMKDALERDYVRDRQIGRFVFFRRADAKAPATAG